VTTPSTVPEPAPAPLPSLTAPTLGLVGATAALLTGGWLMYAPFAQGYQPDGAEWADATVTDFWTGLGLGVLALLAMAALVGGLLGALRAHGVLTARPNPAAAPVPDAPVAPAANDELTALLRPLIEALGRDNAPAIADTTNGATPHHRVPDPAER
jgi:hypothetical protein